jgi:hypothetical protein
MNNFKLKLRMAKGNFKLKHDMAKGHKYCGQCTSMIEKDDGEFKYGMFPCPVCLTEDWSRPTKHHNALHHYGFCGSECIAEHLLIHSGISLRESEEAFEKIYKIPLNTPVICGICNEFFDTRDKLTSLANHMDVKHPDNPATKSGLEYAKRLNT